MNEPYFLPGPTYKEGPGRFNLTFMGDWKSNYYKDSGLDYYSIYLTRVAGDQDMDLQSDSMFPETTDAG